MIPCFKACPHRSGHVISPPGSDAFVFQVPLPPPLAQFESQALAPPRVTCSSPVLPKSVESFKLSWYNMTSPVLRNLFYNSTLQIKSDRSRPQLLQLHLQRLHLNISAQKQVWFLFPTPLGFLYKFLQDIWVFHPSGVFQRQGPRALRQVPLQDLFGLWSGIFLEGRGLWGVQLPLRPFGALAERPEKHEHY